jgi:menaquinone-9 beta-reductase
VSATPVEVVVVGGGLAGSAVATLLARAGRQVVLLERSPAYRWHASGVFTSPASVAALRRIGLADDLLRQVARPTPAMRVETPRGARFRLTYGDDGSLTAPAVGLDREQLDPALVALAETAGVDVRPGTVVGRVDPPARPGGPVRIETSGPNGDDGGGRAALDATIVVGADGIRSVVARSVGAGRVAPFAGRVGLTFHLTDPSSEGPRDARMIVLRDGYVGIAPVPRGRVNIGIVLGSSWRRRLSRDGADDICQRIVDAVAPTPDDPAEWRRGQRLDAIAGAAPIGHQVARRAGPGWFLVGDAAGFLDPFTGEGIHRALVSAELAADTIDRFLAGDAAAPDAYERAMRARFLDKDRVSRLVQAFLGRPAIFEYAARRVATRRAVRDTVGLVMGDLVPAERALDPRFLASLLAP